MDLHCFIMRISPRTITEVMLDLLKSAKVTQKWLKSTPSHTINHIFETKINFHCFVDAVLAQLSDEIRYANHHFCDLVEVVTEVYDKKWGKGKHLVVPLIEVRNYVTMLSVATHDWRAVKNTSKTLIIDSQMGNILYYQFVNECAELAMDRKIAFNYALEDTNIRHKYDILMKGKQESGHLWYESVFDEWSYNEFAKSELLEDKLRKISSKGGDASDVLMNDDSLGITATTVRKTRSLKVNKKELRKVRMDKITDWVQATPNKLEVKYVNTFGNGSKYCGGYHISGLQCNTKGDWCKYGNVERSHVCVCGSKGHAMSTCNQIWK